ncbi:MAG: NADP-dependent oxidoreductase [Bacteroidota bacterium]
MKALQLINYGSISESLKFSEVEKPSISKEDVLIEVKAAAINPIDKSIILGNLQRMLPLTLPCTVAYDVSGIITDLGTDTNDFKVGDFVYARVPQEQMGTLAEYVAVNQFAISKKPANISFEDAAGIPLAMLTALQSFEAANLKRDDRVLVHAGSGGVGTLAIQYAKAKGAYVYTTTSTANVEWVKALGADKVVDYKKEDYKSIVSSVDIVLDTLGGDYSLEAFEVLKKGGIVVSVKGPLDENTAKNIGMTGYKLPETIKQLENDKDAQYKFVFMHPNGHHLNQVRQLVEQTLIKPVTDTVYPFEKSIEAFTHLATGRAKGKIIISFQF